MSLITKLTTEQHKENIEDEKNTNTYAREVMEQVEDGEEVLDPENTSSVLNTVVNTIKNKVEHECPDAAVRLLIVRLICQLLDDCVPGRMYSIPTLPRTKLLAHQVWAIWFTVRTWFGDCNMPGVLVADAMGIGITFTPVATAMICKLLTEKVVKGLPLSMLWGNTMVWNVVMYTHH
jgi:hypothetical protein